MTMDAERVHLNFDEAIAMLAKGGYIHTFRNPNGVLVGASWKREEIIERIKLHGAELSGEMATRMHHGLVLRDNSGWLFIETEKP